MPLLSPLPKCVLASVVAASVHGLIKGGILQFKFLWNVSRLELIEFCVSVIAPLIVGLELGLVIGVATSLIVGIFRHSTAKVYELGQIDTTNNVEYVSIKHFPEAMSVSGIKVIEMRAELSFTNSRRLVEKIRHYVSNDVKYIVVSLAHTSEMDTTSLQQIVQIFEDSKDALICLTNTRAPVRRMLNRYSHLTEPTNIIAENVRTFISTHDAVLYCQKHMRGESVSLNSNDTDKTDKTDKSDKSIKSTNSDEQIEKNREKLNSLYAVNLKNTNKNMNNTNEQKSDSVVNNAIDTMQIILDKNTIGNQNNQSSESHMELY